MLQGLSDDSFVFVSVLLSQQAGLPPRKPNTEKRAQQCSAVCEECGKEVSLKDTGVLTLNRSRSCWSEPG